MALIYNDEVEEVRQKQLTEMLPIIVTHQLLIQGEIHLVGGDGIPVVLRHIDLVDDLFQRGKILPNRLIHQNVSVGQVENFSLHAAFQQAVHDLKSGICFARAGSHHQKNPLLSPYNGVHCAIDGIALIVTGRIGVLAGIVGLFQHRFLRRRQAGFPFIPGDQLLFGREVVKAKFSFLSGKKIMLHKTVSIGAVCKRHVQHLCIGHGLLQAMGNGVMIVLCLDNGDWVILIKIQNIIRPFGLFAEHKIALQIDLSIRDAGFHGDLLPTPLGKNGRRNILQLNIFFTHLLLL